MLSQHSHPKDEMHKVVTRLYHLNLIISDGDKYAQNTQQIRGSK